jgi:hypothetical protein
MKSFHGISQNNSEIDETGRKNIGARLILTGISNKMRIKTYIDING